MKGLIFKMTINIDDKIQEFNEYSKLQTLKNVMSVYNTKRIPDTDWFVELDVSIIDSNRSRAFVHQVNINGIEKQYDIMRKSTIEILKNMRNTHHPKMSDQEFIERCSWIVLVLNNEIPSLYMDRSNWKRVLDRKQVIVK
jgi:hypothetical protein